MVKLQKSKKGVYYIALPKDTVDGLNFEKGKKFSVSWTGTCFVVTPV